MSPNISPERMTAFFNPSFLYSESNNPRCVNSSQIAGKTATVRSVKKKLPMLELVVDEAKLL